MTEPRIILFDIESLPNPFAALEVWPQISNYPGLTLKASINSIACVGYKVLGSAEVNCLHSWDFPEWEKNVNDDGPLCRALYDILKDADCVVGHNSKRFDWKFIQTRFLYHGLPLLPKLHHVDTCAEAKRNLYMFNNSLNTIARFLTDTEKMPHEGWPLWVKTYYRDPEAMKTMSEYCMKDVLVLEEVFFKLRPVIKSLPNYNLFSPMKVNSCPSCGSTRLYSNGKRYTKTRIYRRYFCPDCKGWSHTDLKDEVPR